ncbi:MAG: EamA family transporter [Oscillospiraceae bacterium]|nr:EamA family transporter [Oscillospiraceae bacterium]
MKSAIRTRQDKNTGLFYSMFIASLLIFGTNGIIVSHISIQASQIVLCRTLIGGLMLTILVFLRGGFDAGNIKSEFLFLLFGGVALGLNWVALFSAYRLLNVSLATLIYYAGPMIVLLFSPLLFREKLSGIKIIAVFVVAVGLLCISGSIVATELNTTGLLVAIASALFYAALLVFNKRITKTSGLQTAAIELDIAFIVVLIYTFATTGLPHPQQSDLPYLLIIGLINTGLSYLLYFSGLQKLPAQSVAMISYIDPVSALVFSALLLHESLTVTQLIGAVLIIGGAILGELKAAS